MKVYRGERPVRDPQVISRTIDDETLLLKLDTGQVSVLNEVGGQVWGLVDGRRSLGDIAQLVGRTYAVDQEQVEADIEGFVQALAERQMLSWDPDQE